MNSLKWSAVILLSTATGACLPVAPLQTATLAEATAAPIVPSLATTHTPVTPGLVPASTLSPPYPGVAYVSDQGHFTIRVPEGYRIYVGEKPSVDGVIIPFPNSVTIVSSTSPNFVLNVEYFALEQPLSLEDFISQDDCVRDPTSGRELVVGTETGALFADTLCGPVRSSLVFLVRGEDAYRLMIETMGRYAEVEESVLAVLSTFEWMGQGRPK